MWRSPHSPPRAAHGKGAGLAIIFGNILDTIPGCLVIGAKLAGFEEGSHTTPAARSVATCSAVMPSTDERTRCVSSP